MKTAAFILMTFLDLPSFQADPVSTAGNEWDQDLCVTCKYKDTFDVCFPSILVPIGSQWRCDFDTKEEVVNYDLWECLLTGDDSNSCTAATNSSCIWCAEPIFGLCVTTEVASKLNFLPYFTCDHTTSNSQ